MPKYAEVNESLGAVKNTNYTRADFLATLRYLERNPEVQELTGSGIVDLEYLTTHLNSATGAHVVTLGDGETENQRKELFFIGSGGTWEVTGNFHDWSGLEFDTNGRSAVLIWVNGAWMWVSGNAVGTV